MQVTHFGARGKQAHGASDWRGELETRDWYHVSISFWIFGEIPFLAMFRAHPTITQFLCSFLSSSATQPPVAILYGRLAGLKSLNVIESLVKCQS